MRQLTEREEAIMRLMWERGPLFVREIIDLLPEPKPHFNTVSTFVRILEEKGFVSHNAFGKSHQYFALVSEEEYNRRTVKDIMERYFNNSAARLVSTLVEDEEISLNEIEELINRVKNQ